MANQIDFLVNIITRLQGASEATGEITKIKGELGKLISSTTKISFDKANNPITNLTETFSKGVQGGTELTKVLSKIDQDGTKAITGISSEFKKATPLVNELGLAMKRAFIVAPVWTIARNIMMEVFNTIGENVKFIKDLETAMARINIVGEDTAENYNKMKVNLLALASAYGVSGIEAMKAAELFTQQGRNAQESAQLTRTAMIGALILGEDIRTVADDLTAAIKGFNIPVSQSVIIIDKWVNVARKFAVTSTDLAAATKTAGASANQLGVTMDSYLGDVTAIIEVTRKSGSQAANALQFIYARLTTDGAKTLEQLAGVKTRIDETGRATFALTNVNRNLSDILAELSTKWDGLTNQEKQDIALKVASKRQMTAFLALMQNYDVSLRARIVSLASAGEAQIAFNKIQDTVGVKQEKLSSSFNQLTDTLANTTAWKDILDMLNRLVIGITMFSSFERAVQIETALANDELSKQSEIYSSQATSLKELMTLRRTLDVAPKTAKITSQLELVDEGIRKILDSNQDLANMDLNVSPNKLNQQLDGLIKENNLTAINAKIHLEIDQTEKQKIASQYDDLRKIIADTFSGINIAKFLVNPIRYIEELKSDIANIIPVDIIKERIVNVVTFFVSTFSRLSKELKDRDLFKELLKGKNPFGNFGAILQEELSTLSAVDMEINTKAKIKSTVIEDDARKKVLVSQAQSDEAHQEQLDEEARSLGKLTSAEEERLDIERKMDAIRESGLFTAKEILAAEIAMVSNSNNLYNSHEQVLELQKLQNQASKQQVQDLGRQVKSINDIILAYSKADPFKKIELRRVAELQAMTPKERQTAYETSEYDKNLILDNPKAFGEATEKMAISAEALKNGFDEFTYSITSATGEVGRFTEAQIKAGLPSQMGFTQGQVQAGATQLFPNMGAASTVPGAANVISSASLSFNTTIGAINVALAPETFDTFLDEVGSKVVEELRGNEQLQSDMAKILRDKI